MPLSAKPAISVIIPVHNGGENFRRCLSSIAEAIPPPDEIIAVLDGDTDVSRRLAESFGARAVKLPVPEGPARARNLGAYASQHEILFFIDSDVAICPDAVGQIVAAFRNDPSLAAVFGSYDDEPGATNFLSQYKNLLHHYVHQKGREDASTFWGACGAIRREIFLAVDGFDERYRYPSIEDIEMGYRLKQAGLRIRLLKSLQVKHLKSWDLVSLVKSDVFHRALPWTELILRDRRFIE
jgi:GT2 family glycosyltransferase